MLIRFAMRFCDRCGTDITNDDRVIIVGPPMSRECQPCRTERLKAFGWKI